MTQLHPFTIICCCTILSREQYWSGVKCLWLACARRLWKCLSKWRRATFSPMGLGHEIHHNIDVYISQHAAIREDRGGDKRLHFTNTHLGWVLDINVIVTNIVSQNIELYISFNETIFLKIERHYGKTLFVIASLEAKKSLPLMTKWYKNFRYISKKMLMLYTVRWKWTIHVGNS